MCIVLGLVGNQTLALLSFLLSIISHITAGDFTFLPFSTINFIALTVHTVASTICYYLASKILKHFDNLEGITIIACAISFGTSIGLL